MRFRFDLDITAPTPFSRPVDDGLTAILAARPGALRTRIPDEDIRPPVTTPAPKVDPKPKPKPAPPTPTPSNSTPTKSTDQAKQGVANKSKPAVTPPVADPVAPRPTPKTKAAPKPKPKATPVRNEPPADKSDKAPKGSKTPKTTGKKPAVDTDNGAPGNGTSTPAVDRGGRDGKVTTTTADDRRTPAGGTGGANGGTPAVDIESPAFIQQMKIDAARNKVLEMREDGNVSRSGDDRRVPLGGHPTGDGGETTIVRGDKDGKDKDYVDPESPEGITQLKLEAARNRLQAEREAEKADDAKVLDKKYTKAELAEIKAEQDALKAREKKVRKNNTPDQTEKVEDLAPRNRFFREEAGEIDATTKQTRKEKITALREEHIEKYGVWVDADGTVYQASVNDNGRIIGVRENTTPAKGDQPGLEETRRISIGVMNHRWDTNRIATIPTGKPGEVNQVRTESVHTGPRGKTLNSSITLEQERVNKDGSKDRSRTREDYDANGKATKLSERNSVIGADGKPVSRNGRDTFFRADGTTPDHTVETSTTFNGGDTKSRKVEEAVTTYFRADGVTPRHEMVVTNGWDANGNEPMTTYASTDFNKSGDALSTFTRRDVSASIYGDGEGDGELPEGMSAREYVTYNADGTVADKAQGGTGLTETDFKAFVKDGTKPDTVDVDQGDIDDLEDSLEENRERLDRLENGGGYAGSGGRGYSGSSAYTAAGATNSVDELRDLVAAQEAELEQLKTDQQYASDHEISEVDTTVPNGSEEAQRYTRTTQNGDDGRFDNEGLGFKLAEPLEPSTTTPSVFEVPAMLQTRANAQAIDSTKYAKDPAAFRQLQQEQGDFERTLAGIKDPARREAQMREYFETHKYWIDSGPDGTSDPVLMASGWSPGVPYSNTFGNERAKDPHAALARTGIQGQDEQGNPAEIDVLRNLYVNGSRDEIVRTSYEGPSGASRTSVIGEHINAGGVITERDTNVQSTIPRTREGKEPLAVTEISEERFNERTGLPQGRQYAAMATSDDSTTSLQEQSDYYNSKGVIFDTKIETTQMTRSFDEEQTRDFLADNAAIIEAASKGKDDFHPDDEEFQDIDVPPVGSSWSHSETDIDYDAKGRAIYSATEEESIQVVALDPEFDDGDNGVKVVETKGGYTYGEPDGTTPIFNKQGEPVVDKVSKSTITSSTFDPDAGVAGGDGKENNRFSEITTVTVGETRSPDGTVTTRWATPYQVDTFQEGSDDDWGFERKYLKTSTDIKSDRPFEVVFNDDKEPVELGAGDEVWSANGNRVVKEHDGYTTGDLDAADKFEEFMGGTGGWIVAGVAVAAGAAAAIFTGGASLVGGLLIATALVGGAASATAVGINYSQGEASGLDFGLAVAGTVLPGVGAVLARGARVASLANAARTAANAGSRVVPSIADDAVRAATSTGRASLTRTVMVSDVGLDGYDVYEAGRAALQGQFYGAGLVLLAGLGGVAAPKIRGRIDARNAGDTPNVDATGGGATGAPDLQPAPVGADGVPNITSLDPNLTDDGRPRNNRSGDGERDGANGAPPVVDSNGAIPLPASTRDRSGTDADTDAVTNTDARQPQDQGGADAAPAQVRTADLLNDGTTYKNLTGGQPNTTVVQRRGDDVTGYSTIGPDGRATQVVVRQADGSWVVRTPGPNGIWNPKLVTERPATATEIPAPLSDVELSARLRAEAGSIPAIDLETMTHVTRRHHPAFRDVIATLGGLRNGELLLPSGRIEGYNSTTDSFWRADMTPTEIQSMTTRALAEGTWTRGAGGYRVTYDTGQTVGTDSNGAPTSRISVIVENGGVYTVYPYDAPNPTLPANVTRAFGNPPANRHGVDSTGIDRPDTLGPLDAQDSARLQDLTARALADLDIQVVTNRHDLPQIIARGGQIPNVGAVRNPLDGRSSDIHELRPLVEERLGTNADGSTQYAGLYFSRNVTTPDGTTHVNLGQSSYGPDALVLDPGVLWRSTVTGRDSFDVDPTDASQLPGSVEDLNYVISRRIADTIGQLDGRSDAEIIDAIQRDLTSAELNRSYFEVQIRNGYSLDEVTEIRSNPRTTSPTNGDRPGPNVGYLNDQRVREWAEANNVPLTEVPAYFTRNSYGGLDYVGNFGVRPEVTAAAQRADVQRQHDDQLAPEGLVSQPSWMTPEFMERIGRVAEVTTQRAGRSGAGIIPGTTVTRLSPGQPLDFASLDPNQRYIWVVDADGAFAIGAESQNGQTLKHGNLMPASDVGGRAAARAGGELSFVNGHWQLNNGSSYSFARLAAGHHYTGRHDEGGFAIIRDPDGNEIAINPENGISRDGAYYRADALESNDHLYAVSELLRRSGTDMSGVRLNNILEPNAPTMPAIAQGPFTIGPQALGEPIPGGLGGVHSDGRNGLLFEPAAMNAAWNRMWDSIRTARSGPLPMPTATGDLPAGIYHASLDGVSHGFGGGSRRRRQLDRQLDRATGVMRAAGVEQVMIGGSYIGTRRRPGDIDIAVIPRRDGSTVNVQELQARISAVAPDVHVYAGHEMPSNSATLPGATPGENFVELFQHTRDGDRRGAVLVGLDGQPTASGLAAGVSRATQAVGSAAEAFRGGVQNAAASAAQGIRAGAHGAGNALRGGVDSARDAVQAIRDAVQQLQDLARNLQVSFGRSSTTSTDVAVTEPGITRSPWGANANPNATVTTSTGSGSSSGTGGVTSRIRDRVSSLDARTVGSAILHVPFMTTHAMEAAILAEAQVDRERLALAQKAEELRHLIEQIGSTGGGLVIE